MAPYRRPRGTLRDGAHLGYAIERDAKNRLDALADHAKVSSAVFLEQLIAHVELNERGLPVWWPEQPELEDGELPINTA